MCINKLQYHGKVTLSAVNPSRSVNLSAEAIISTIIFFYINTLLTEEYNILCVEVLK